MPDDGISWAFSPTANPCFDKWQGLSCSIISNIYRIKSLLLSEHNLRGSIPTSIYNLSQLQTLSLYSNQLTGSIPSSIGKLSKLKTLKLDNNQLTGSIFSSIGSLKQLINVYLDSNHLTGIIPSSVGELNKLVYFDVYNNELNGTIPASIGRLKGLVALGLDNNQLSGTIPDSIGNLSSLVYLDLYQNELYGSIPTSIGNLQQLVTLDIDTNHLIGTIPSTIGNLVNLVDLDLSVNFLSGSVPSSLRNCTKLSTLLLQGNKLVGSLDRVFSKAQASLSTIKLDFNQITGELPFELFELSSLTFLSVIGSCLHGTLPDNICNSTKLEALILYGLFTGASCRTVGLQSLSAGAAPGFHGAFPVCLFAVPKLRTLMIASNDLTGNLDRGLKVSRRMVQLDLSHNLLSGSIPDSIQNHTWLSLDLSHNKFKGTLHKSLFEQHNFSYGMEDNLSNNLTIYRALSLSNNRLSGPVPSSVKPLRSVSILAGNLFECKYDKSNLPQNDQDVDTYQCASNAFNVSIYVWLGLLICFSIVHGVYYYHGYTASRVSAISVDLCCVNSLLQTFEAICMSAIHCATFGLLVLCPYYVVSSYYQGTHTFQYAYLLSGIYTTGIKPFVVETVLVGAMLVVFCAGALKFTRRVHTKSTLAIRTIRMRRRCVWLTFALVNLLVVLGVNVAFIYIVLYGSSRVQTVAQIALSGFKTVWSLVVSPLMIRRVDKYLLPRETATEHYFILQLLVALFNNIAIPCLVVMAIDPNCFNEILAPPQTESVDYVLPECTVLSYGAACTISYTQSSLQFTPPFTYSYQCSASFITSYAPTFIYMSVSTAIISPLLQQLLLKLYIWSSPDSILRCVVSRLLSRILKTDQLDVPSADYIRMHPLVGAVGILVNLLTQFGILLTFGGIFPPIAAAMTVSIVSVVYTTMVKLDNLVQYALRVHQPQYLSIIDVECAEVATMKQLQLAAKIILCYSCAFYTLFLFDILGDAEGFAASVWVLFVFPTLPFVVFGSIELYVHIAKIWWSVRNNNFQQQQTVEMVDFNAQYKQDREQVLRQDPKSCEKETVNVMHETYQSNIIV